MITWTIFYKKISKFPYFILIPLIILNALLLSGVVIVSTKEITQQIVNREREILLWSDNFNSPDWISRWHIREKGVPRNIEVIADPSSKFTKILRVHYKKGSINPANASLPGGGTTFHASLGLNPSDDLYLRYYIRFANDFLFNRGGKLPGLFGGATYDGGSIPNGANGFSTRYMWRRNGLGELYAYLPTSVDYGTSLGQGGWKFVPGVWHSLEQHVTLNTLGKKNGIIQVWFDGRLVLDEQDLYFRSTNKLKIEGIFFSTFFGGHDLSWAVPIDTYADFANFAVSNSYIGI